MLFVIEPGRTRTSDSTLSTYGIETMPFYTVLFGVSRCLKRVQQRVGSLTNRLASKHPKLPVAQWLVIA